MRNSSPPGDMLPDLPTVTWTPPISEPGASREHGDSDHLLLVLARKFGFSLIRLVKLGRYFAHFPPWSNLV